MPYAATVMAATLVLWVAGSILIGCYSQLWGSTPRHAPDDFLRRLIPQLRALDRDSIHFEGAQELARVFEWFLSHPADDWRPTCTGDQTTDREIVALWLEYHAHAPAFCAPSWTRIFSECLAWVLRHRYPITDKSLHEAQRAIIREGRTRWGRHRHARQT